MTHPIRKIGIIGAGFMADKHAQVFKACPEVDLTAIYSRSPAKAKALQEKYGIKKVSLSLDALVNDQHLDGIIVAVSEDSMREVVKQLLPYKIPLLIEKPAGRTVEENHALAKIANDYKTPTMVAYNRRFYSIFQQGMRIIADHGGLLGVHIEGHERFWRIKESGRFSQDVMDNWIYANSTHTIDLLRLFGGTISDVSAFSRSAFGEKNGDEFVANIIFDNGAFGQYQSFWFSPGGWRVVLYAKGATVEFKPLEQGQWIDKDFKTYPIVPDQHDTTYKPGLYGQAKAFIGLMQTGKLHPSAIDIAGALETMQLAQQFTSGRK